MNERLQPSTLGEILDRTALIYRTRFLVYFGIGVIPAGTVLVFAAAFFVTLAWTGSGTSDSLANGVPSLTAVGVLGILAILALPACLGTTALGWAAMTIAASRVYLGESITIRNAYKAAWNQGGRFIGLYLLLALVIGAVPFTAFVLALPVTGGLTILARQSSLGTAVAPLLGFGFFLLAVVLAGFALWMLLCLSLAYPSCVVEKLSAWGAIKRGYTLSKGTRGRIFLLFLLGSALGWLLAIGTSIPIFIVIALIPGANSPQHAQLLGEILMFIWYGLWFAVQAFTKPVYGIALTLFYFDQRIRTEGFDIEWMMQQAGLVPVPPPTPEASPWLSAVPPAPPQPAPAPASESQSTAWPRSESDPPSSGDQA